MSHELLSYLRVVYGRHRGKCSIIRIFKVGENGKLSYVEKRQHKTNGEIMWRIGNVKQFNVGSSELSASNEQEYNEYLSESLKNIQ